MASPRSGIAARFRPAGGGWVVLAASLVGAVGFLYPFLLPALAAAEEAEAHAADAPVLFALLTVLCLVAIAAEFDGTASRRHSPAKTVALLGVLVAVDSTLRLAPSFLGASPIFPLIILAGAVFGPAFGFQLGALTLLVSAFVTGGVGPWLPYQMLGAGWVGLTAGWQPRPASFRRRLLLLAAFGAAWGFLYGALLNLWSWPFAAPGLGTDAGLYWSPGLGMGDTLARYAKFYVVTSLGYDLFRAAGNAALILALGGPVLRVLERYRARFGWQPWTEEPGESAPATVRIG
jgi:energy-coupling factor transport system substrate-specific component